MSEEIPQDQGSNQGVGYGRPPVEHQFKPGVSGNPGGRPKGRSITARIRELLEQPAIDCHGKVIEGKTWGDKVAEALIREAASGDTRAAKELIDRIEGKARIAPEERDDVDARAAAIERARRIVDARRRRGEPERT